MFCPKCHVYKLYAESTFRWSRCNNDCTLKTEFVRFHLLIHFFKVFHCVFSMCTKLNIRFIESFYWAQVCHHAAVWTQYPQTITRQIHVRVTSMLQPLGTLRLSSCHLAKLPQVHRSN